LVVEAHDSVKQQTFYRPLGGGIEFGEGSEAAVIREIREEIGAEIADLQYIGTLENIFTYNGANGHEIVQIYDARFVDEALYAASRIPGVESDGEPIHVVWKPLGHFSAERPLYPDGLLELLEAKSREA
jgi:8-oxo-dGTP pyrophosphatase MutT (NUDIX family)